MIMRYYEDIEVGEIDRFGAYAVTREEVIEFATLPIVSKISPKQLLKSFSPFMVAPGSTINLEKVTQVLT